MTATDDAVAPAELGERQRWAHIVLGVVQHLPDTERDVVILSYIEQRPYRAIASELGLSLSAVRRSMASALASIASAQMP